MLLTSANNDDGCHRSGHGLRVRNELKGRNLIPANTNATGHYSYRRPIWPLEHKCHARASWLGDAPVVLPVDLHKSKQAGQAPLDAHLTDSAGILPFVALAYSWYLPLNQAPTNTHETLSIDSSQHHLYTILLFFHFFVKSKHWMQESMRRLESRTFLISRKAPEIA